MVEVASFSTPTPSSAEAFVSAPTAITTGIPISFSWRERVPGPTTTIIYGLQGSVDAD